MAMAEASKVPLTSGRTPNRFSEKSGVHSVPKRNSWIGTSRRNATVSVINTEMIPTVTRIDPAAQRNSARSMKNSATLRTRIFISDESGSTRQTLFECQFAAAIRDGVHRTGGASREPLVDQLVLPI